MLGRPRACLRPSGLCILRRLRCSCTQGICGEGGKSEKTRSEEAVAPKGDKAEVRCGEDDDGAEVVRGGRQRSRWMETRRLLSWSWELGRKAMEAPEARECVVRAVPGMLNIDQVDGLGGGRVCMPRGGRAEGSGVEGQDGQRE